MRSIATAVAAAIMVFSTLAGCSQSGPGPGTSTGTTVPLSVIAEHETAGDSPIGYGLSVPEGAVQLGPLVRRRSEPLIAAYQELLEEARQQLAAEQAQEDADLGVTGTTPLPTYVPGSDTFALLEDPPPPDITTALLRVDGEPGVVLEEMLRQLAVVLPDSRLRPARWQQYCEATDGFYTGCTVTQEGRTLEDVGLRVVISLDPGNVKKSLAPPAANLRPVMTVTAQLTDEPAPDSIDDGDPPVAGPDDDADPSTGAKPPRTPPADDQGPLVEATWPRLEAQAASTTGSRLLNDSWIVRSETTLLLSGYTPGVAMLLVDRSVNADAIARSYVLDFSNRGAPNVDVLEDRNEINTTYTARTKEPGLSVSASLIQSGRGTYVALFYTATPTT